MWIRKSRLKPTLSSRCPPVYGISEWLLKALPLCLIGLGFGGRLPRTGMEYRREGQLVMGGIFATAVMVYAQNSITSGALVVLMILAGIVGGMVAGLAAWMRTQFNANEILTTLMLVYVAQSLLQYLLVGTVDNTAPLQDPMGAGFPQSQMFPAHATLPLLVNGCQRSKPRALHVGVLLILLAVPLMWLFVKRSFIGFQMTVAGLAPKAANYAGFKTNRLIWLALLISGGSWQVWPVRSKLPVRSVNCKRVGARAMASPPSSSPFGALASDWRSARRAADGAAHPRRRSAANSMSLPQSVSMLFQGLIVAILPARMCWWNYRIVWKNNHADCFGAASTSVGYGYPTGIAHSAYCS